MATLCRRLASGLRISNHRTVSAGHKFFGSSTVKLSEIENSTNAVSKSSDTKAAQNVSKAMQSYMERANSYNEFMDEQRQEFTIGRRHLANMMGKDPENFTQDDINEAIRYLFPSGLFQIKARPQMRPPEELYPKQKDAEFDALGRPHHPFFYTTKPNFFFTVHELVNKISRMNAATSHSTSAEKRAEIDGFMNGTKWISKEEVETRLLEKLSEPLFNDLIATLERMVAHVNIAMEFDHIKEFRQPLASLNVLNALPPVEIEPDGRKKATMLRCGKKTSKGQITVRYPGTGEFNINGKMLDFFTRIQSREMVIAPLQRVGWLGKVDVEAKVEGVGESNNAVAVRYGIAHGIAALGADTELLRLGGYLTHDRRRKERKKPGRVGARAKWTWKKR